MARKLIEVKVVLSVKAGTTKREAIRELRTRCNELCCYSMDEEDVRVRKAS